MKKFGLSSQIWLLFGLVMLFLCVILAVVFRWSIRDFFTTEAYMTIESAQEMKLLELQGGLVPGSNIYMGDLKNIRDVGHIIVLNKEYGLLEEYLEGWRLKIGPDVKDDLKTGSGQSLNLEISSIMIWGTISPDILPLLGKIRENAELQKSKSGRYETEIGNRKLFYVIRSEELLDRNITFISYMWDTYKNTLSSTLFSRLFFVIAIVVILSLIIAILFSRYLPRPLKKLSEDVKAIAARNWDKPISINRKDEIGELADSMEMMRASLSEQDREQQAMLQFISHELKTPVMVIRSYAQAIKDGIYPGGDLDSAIDVIDKEIQRMDMRVKDLLFITRLEYLSRHNLQLEKIELSELIESVAGRFYYQRGDIEWDLRLEKIQASVNEEQFSIVIENILTNELRYARQKIEIVLKTIQKDSKILITFKNDGEAIEEKRLQQLFKPFNKGAGGEHGLGLNIVKRIVELHNGRVWIENEEDGVSTHIELPV
jgi:two-component system sensor histidine kinase CssS